MLKNTIFILKMYFFWFDHHWMLLRYNLDVILIKIDEQIQIWIRCNFRWILLQLVLFLFAKQLYTWPCLFVCLCVCSPFLICNISLPLNIKNILESSKRERFYIKNRQTTNKHTDVRNESYVLHLRRSVINWQRWLEVGTLVDNSITCLGWN